MKYTAVVVNGHASIHTNVCSRALVEMMEGGGRLIPVSKIDEAVISIELLKVLHTIPELTYHDCCSIAYIPGDIVYLCKTCIIRDSKKFKERYFNMLDDKGKCGLCKEWGRLFKGTVKDVEVPIASET